MNETKNPYWKKLLDPRWQKKRLEVFERDGFKCRYCDSESKTLQVHHLYYVSGREPWEYHLGAFKTACSSCHKELKQESKNAAYWEYFCHLENEHSLITGIDLPFIVNLMWCANQIGCPDVELLDLITDALREGIIDHETVLKWRADLKDKNKEVA